MGFPVRNNRHRVQRPPFAGVVAATLAAGSVQLGDNKSMLEGRKLLWQPSRAY
jgi:hypothetical protein